jgi:hypothetical protein
MALLLLALAGCAESEPPPSPVVGIVEATEFDFRDTGEPVPEILALQQGTGVFAEIRIQPSPSPPANYEGRPVQPSEEWAILLVLYPSGGELADNDRYLNWCPTYEGDTRSRSVTLGVDNGWRAGGYTRAPDPLQVTVGPGTRPKSAESVLRPGWLTRWTYLSSPTGEAGEWDYEILVFPTNKQETRNTGKSGKPLSILKGRLVVTESE